MQLSHWFLAFLAVLLPLYFIVPRRGQPAVLLLGSLVFYACAGWRALCVMLALTLINYAVGRIMGGRIADMNETLTAHRADGSWDKPTRKRYRDRCLGRIRLWLGCGIALDVALLAAFKLSLPAHLGATAWLLPMGLSFVALSAIGYLFDVFREQQPCEESLARFALFVFYFPHMWQGPISRYGELMPQLIAPHRPDGRRLCEGAMRALWGGIKKLVIADTAAIATAALLARQSELGGAGMLVLIPLYTVQIYADFTGGMDIALGVSGALGIALYENFDHPFSAPSLREYWRRWHRSLGRFFTDYIFYPLSVSRPAQWLSRRARDVLGEALGRRVPLYAAMLLTWLGTGLWHGFGFNFVLWGLLNGALLLLSQELRPLRERLEGRWPRLATSRIRHALLCLGTLLTAALLRTLDLNARAAVTLSLWADMLSLKAWRGMLEGTLWRSLGLNTGEWGLLGLGIAVMWWVGHMTPRLDEDAPTLRARIAARPLLCAAVCALAIAVITIFGKYGIGYDASCFIYGQF